jgi:hypothetical protein
VDYRTFADAISAVCWPPSLLLPLGLGLGFHRRPTVWELIGFRGSRQLKILQLTLVPPVLCALTLCRNLLGDARLPLPLSIAATLGIAAVTVLVLHAGFRRGAPAFARDRPPPSVSDAELPGYEEAYAHTIAELEDAIAPGRGRPPRGRRRPRRGSGDRH